MRAEVAISAANRGSACYLCKEVAAIVAVPRDLDDPDITPEADEWYPHGLLSCWGCIRKILTMLMSDPKLPEREADALEDEVAAIPPERLGRLESKIDAVGEEMDK